MPFRFYRRRTVVPGVRLNLSRSGPSLSFGPRGAHYTVGHGHRRATVGIPGTGLFYTQYSHQHARATGRRRPVSGPAAAAPSPAGVVDLFHKPPGAKIGYGILFTLLVITAPFGLPLLLTGIVQLFGSKRWRARKLIARAHSAPSPEASKVLLDAAAAALPTDPEVLASQAAWNVGQHQWDAAVDLYARYLAQAPGDPVARGQYARALLMDAQVDDAIAQLLQVRALSLDDESEASITSLLALAWLMKGDAHQALAIVRQAPLQRHTLGVGLQQCLRLRAIAQYLSGSTARSVADLDRLYAVNPAYPEVVEDKAAMQAGTFTLQTPLGPLTRAGRGGAAALPAAPEQPPPTAPPAEAPPPETLSGP